MIDDALLWLHALQWFPTLKMLHITGIVLGLGGALMGHSLAMRTLMNDGQSPRPGLVWALHLTVVAGLCTLWLSGTALALSQYTLATLPTKIVLKLCIATVLSFNALLLQEYLIPLSIRFRRPLAVNLPLNELIKATLIGATSSCCWIALAAMALLAPLQHLPLTHLFILWAGLWATMVAGALGVLLIRRRGIHDRDASDHSINPARGSGDSSASHGMHEHAVRGPTREPAPLSLTERLRHIATSAPVNDNTGSPSGAQVEEPHRPIPDARSIDADGAGHAASEPRETRHRWFSQFSKRRSSPGPKEAHTSSARFSLTDVRQACQRAFVGAATVSFFVNMLMLTGPLFMLQVYDRVLTSKSVPTLIALFGLVVALFVFMGLLDLIRSRLLVRIGLRVDRMLAGRAFEHATLVSGAKDQEHRAQILQDVQHIRQFISGAGTVAIFDMPWTPIYLVVIAMFHWSLGVVALVGAALLIALSLLNEVFSRKPVAAATQHAAKAENTLSAARHGCEILHAMGMTDRYQKRWLDDHNAEMIAQTRAADVAGLLSVITKTSRLLLQSAMLAVGAYLALGNAISPGVMIAASIIMSRALAPVELAIAHWRGFIAARQGIGRLRQAFSRANDRAERMALPQPEGHVHAENVFAAAIGGNEPLLKGINFKLAPGDALGVLGPSGAGKSTLARVLVGIWPTLRGHVRLDNAPLAQWPVEQLGQHVGYLPQNAQLFDGSVAENIARFDPEARSSDIIAAARAANVHDMIVSLSDGYNTRVGDDGVALSGGQRQRLALARALYGDPAFVVLDEPNSNLDSDGETALAQAIKAVRESGRTLVVMAHRRKALEHVSHLLILNDGRQVLFGAKEDVLQANLRARSNERRRKLHVAK